MELHSIDFRSINSWLKSRKKRIRIATLGDNSYLYCEYVNDNKILVIGSAGAYKIIGVRFWNRVCRRMDSLNEMDRIAAGKYADTIEWNNPDYFFAPSVPAICKAYFEDVS